MSLKGEEDSRHLSLLFAVSSIVIILVVILIILATYSEKGSIITNTIHNLLCIGCE